MVEDMERDRTRRTYLERAEEEAKRICESKAAGSPGGTCWNGEGTVRRKQPWLMGEGLGMSLPSFPSDKATCRGRPVLGDGEISDHRTPRKKSKKDLKRLKERPRKSKNPKKTLKNPKRKRGKFRKKKKSLRKKKE